MGWVPVPGDPDAIHKSVPEEILNLPSKATPVAGDLVVIEDSQDDYRKKAVDLDDLPSGADSDAIHDNVAGEIQAITEKSTPVSADLVIIEDSADSYNKKKVQVGNLPGGGGGGGGTVTFDIKRYEAGDITVSATTIGTTLQAALDMTLPAAAGDVIEVGIDLRPQSVDGELRLDFATRVSSADVTYFSTGDGTPAAGGIQGLNRRLTGVANQTFGANGSIPLVLGSGDISGGNVTVRVYAWRAINNIIVDADSDRPLITWMKNYGH